MCIICVSKKGVRQPTLNELKKCFEHNSDGAGIMVYNEILKKVEISKGFMKWEDFKNYVTRCNFTKDDIVVYHFRIGTQGNKVPELTHPYPLTSKLENCKALDCVCKVGIAHNGIITLTSDGNSDYNDTMLFITKYLSKLIKNRNEYLDKDIQSLIKELTNSKFAMINNRGEVVTIGDFINEDGLLFSNNSYKSYDYRYYHKNYNNNCNYYKNYNYFSWKKGWNK